jgi:hypothetical protein
MESLVAALLAVAGFCAWGAFEAWAHAWLHRSHNPDHGAHHERAEAAYGEDGLETRETVAFGVVVLGGLWAATAHSIAARCVLLGFIGGTLWYLQVHWVCHAKTPAWLAKGILAPHVAAHRVHHSAPHRRLAVSQLWAQRLVSSAVPAPAHASSSTAVAGLAPPPAEEDSRCGLPDASGVLVYLDLPPATAVDERDLRPGGVSEHARVDTLHIIRNGRRRRRRPAPPGDGRGNGDGDGPAHPPALTLRSCGFQLFSTGVPLAPPPERAGERRAMAAYTRAIEGWVRRQPCMQLQLPAI